MAERTVARKRREDSAAPTRKSSSTSDLASMKVDELRRLAKENGASGTSAMRKDELIKAVSKALTKSARDGAKKTTAAKSTSAKTTAAKTTAAKSTSTRSTSTKSTSANSTSAKSTSARSTAKKADTKKSTASGTGGARRGSATSKSLKYSQEITSTDEAPERSGRSLVTTDHDVIRQWAEERDAVPASVEGSEHDGHLGVLRFDFPGGDRDGRLVEVSWDEWFETFDARQLNFIYQEERSDGRQSNFFRLENPEREDG